MCISELPWHTCIVVCPFSGIDSTVSGEHDAAAIGSNVHSGSRPCVALLRHPQVFGGSSGVRTPVCPRKCSPWYIPLQLVLYVATMLLLCLWELWRQRTWLWYGRKIFWQHLKFRSYSNITWDPSTSLNDFELILHLPGAQNQTLPRLAILIW